MNQSNKPAFNPRIFWDVDYDQLDVDTKTEFVIVRVFERGDTPDIRKCRKYFGDQKITDTLLNTKHLSKHRLYLASAIINKPLSSFRCYTMKP